MCVLHNAYEYTRENYRKWVDSQIEKTLVKLICTACERAGQTLDKSYI
jgi:hypothetical protein